jgi:hypothetical protein
LDVLCLAAAETQEAALTNLISSSFDGTLHGTVTFTANDGFHPDGIDGYIDTEYLANTAAGNFTQTSASFGLWMRDVPDATSPELRPGAMGCNTTGVGECDINVSTTEDGIIFRINDAGWDAPIVSVPQRTGLVAVNRSSDSFKQAYINGTPLMLPNWDGDPLLPANNFLVGAVNSQVDGGPTQYYEGRIAAWFIGGSLTPDEHALLYAAIQAFDEKSVT